MGVWSSNVFGNDWTADFAIEFDNTELAKRVDLLRRTLNETLHADDDDDDLEEYAGAAVAAAAIIATTRPGGPSIGDGGPQHLAGLVVPADLVALALRAFDRVIGEEPEYAAMWDDPEFAPALKAVRAALSTQPSPE
jgi:hypothetical protein